MVLFNHLKRDISRMDDLSCLLAKPSNNHFMMSNAEADNWGCYLFWDDNDDKYIRSGKATGVGGFKKRMKEHKRRAESPHNDDGSKLYDLYPSKLSPRADSGEGFFEDILQLIVVLFKGDPTDCSIPFDKDYSEGGLFFYTAKEKQHIERTKFPGKTGVLNFMEMAAYLFEIGYDVAISRRHNVSGSPGIEGCGLMGHQV